MRWTVHAIMICVFLSGLLCQAALATGQSPPVPDGLDAEASEPAARDVKLTETIPKEMKKASVPGAIVGIWKDGEAPYVRAFGVRDTATGEPMATDLYTRIGSVTKSFTTTAILQLVDEGQLGLDDPISKYVPGVHNPPIGGHAQRAFQLLG